MYVKKHQRKLKVAFFVTSDDVTPNQYNPRPIFQEESCFLFNVPYFSKVPELRPPKQKTKKKAHKKSFSLDIKSRSHTRCCSMYMEADSKKS